MFFSVNRDHRNYYRQHHWIECEGVLTEAELKRLNEGIGTGLVEKLGKTDTFSPEQAFQNGRDLWRRAPGVKKVLHGRNLAGIAAELIESKPLRFGYDMLFPSLPSSQGGGAYANFLQTSPTLAAASSIQGVQCGAMLSLSAPEEQKEDLPPSSLFSTIPGNAVFFAPDWPLPLNEILHRDGYTYLLLVYTKPNAVYLFQQGDPHVNSLKACGYNFGDRLNDQVNPIVYV
jgi:hypothetical protein